MAPAEPQPATASSPSDDLEHDGMPREPSLRGEAAAGARWTSVSVAVSGVAQIVQLVALTRLLSPGELGLAASATVIIGLAGYLGDAGINNAIIAKQTTDRRILSSLYWANLLVGVIVAGLVVASIPLATAAFDAPALAGLLLLAAPASIVVSLGQQFGVMLQKELRFKPLAAIESVSTIVGVAVAVAVAYNGGGATSVIAGYLAQAISSSMWLAIRGWSTGRPHLRLRRSDLRGYLSFGLLQMGERVTNFLGSNLDYMLVGGFLGTRLLGVYSVAFRLVTIPQLRLNPIITRVAYPVFARRRHDDAALCRGYLEVTRLVAFVSFPIMVGFAVTAPWLVPVVFGDQWEASIPVLQVLSIVGAFFSLSNPNGSVYLAKNRPDLGLKLNLFRLVLIVAVFVPAVDGGIVAVAWAFVAVVVVMFVVSRLVLRNLVGLSLRSYLQALQGPALCSAAMALTVLGATPALEAGLSDPFVLLMQLVLAATAYLACTAIFTRDWARQTWRLAFRGN